ncbi:FCD domain-containing protein [Pararoseomonas indoligenes]|uniref:FCD domain-containing protein n=1 Tax=Roseomonas indoligenes TaxID=2820811 RepID=A0A940N966_9PROT|nr:FCD domain-containing protein [Pararoseomonas indoligenes]MBP0496342.1 FCD domain-containing protein [Pararoseomonas indoligenes]
MVATRPEARLGELARRVTDLAAQRGWAAGRHVTEAELCEALQVSRTPVRSALRLLEEEGVVEARPGRGFHLRMSGPEAGRRRPRPQPTVEEALLARILRDRVSGELPAEVTRSLLLRRYASGRAVMEGVIARLADEGLLLRGGGRVLRFAASVGDEASVRASYEVRLVVEPAALLLPGFRPDPEVLAVLRDRHRASLDDFEAGRGAAPGALVALDADFHLTLAGFSGNPFMVALVRQQTDLRRLMEYAANEDSPRVRLWLKEHIAVLDAVTAGDLALAAQALRGHLERAARFAGAPARDTPAE